MTRLRRHSLMHANYLPPAVLCPVNQGICSICRVSTLILYELPCNSEFPLHWISVRRLPASDRGQP